jgi:tetratricopeptide (TPR) repeat protein
LAYERQEQAFRLYVPEMFKAIDPVKEDKRIAGVQFATQRAERIVKPAAPAPKPLSEFERKLQQADELYRQKQFEAAAQSYRELLRSGASRPDQAKAYYGLARISLQQSKPQLAEELFQKILENDPEPFERGWAHVYLARLSMASSEPDPAAARRHYQAVLALAGASEGALKSAQAELARLPEN